MPKDFGGRNCSQNLKGLKIVKHLFDEIALNVCTVTSDKITGVLETVLNSAVVVSSLPLATSVLCSVLKKASLSLTTIDIFVRKKECVVFFVVLIYESSMCLCWL